MEAFIEPPIIKEKALWAGNGFRAIQSQWDNQYGLHERVTPETWWRSALQVELHLNPGGKVRIKAGEGGTFPVPIGSVPNFCQGQLDKKIAFSVAVMKGGQREEDMEYPLLRVIDLDTNDVATDAQFLTVSQMFPGALLIRSNGIQIFLEVSDHPWQSEAELLASMGRLAAARTGLIYDAHHLRRDDIAADVQSHLYRTPWGWASHAKREVWCFEPRCNPATVMEAAAHLGISLSPRAFAPSAHPVSKPRECRFKSPRAGLQARGESQGGSEADKKAEFTQILALRRKVLAGGGTVEQAYEQILTTAWVHYNPKAIQRVVAKLRTPDYIPKPFRRRSSSGGATPLTDDEREGYLRDQQTALTRLGPISTFRRLAQNTFAVFGDRAWSFQWLYRDGRLFGATVNDALEAFFNWPMFETVRDISVANLGQKRVEEDLRRCWTKYHNYTPALVHSGLMSAVRKAITDLDTVNAVARKPASFTTAAIQPLVWQVKSRRHLQRVLALLVEEGFLTKVGNRRSTQWCITLRHTSEETKRGVGEGIEPVLPTASSPSEGAPEKDIFQEVEVVVHEVAAERPANVPEWKAKILASLEEVKRKTAEERAKPPCPRVTAFLAQQAKDIEEIAKKNAAKKRRSEAWKRRQAGMAYVKTCERFLKEVDRLVEEEGLTDQQARQVARPIRAPRFRPPASTSPLGSWKDPKA